MYRILTASFHVLMNANPDLNGGGAAPAPAPAASAEPNPAPTPAPAAASNPAPTPSPFDFIPESLRNEGWVTKYKTPDDLWKGIDSTIKKVGEKQVVQGIQKPGENATPEERQKFYNDLGRPESADKYVFPEDVKAHEGFDLDAEKKVFAEIIHKSGITQDQASELFRNYIETINSNQISLDDAKKAAFPQDTETRFAQAKKGSDAHGLTDKLNAAGLGRDPLVLQLCALLGDSIGEGTIVKNDAQPQGSASLLEEAKRIQQSAEYLANDKEAHRRVQEIYSQVYPG